MLGLLGCDTAYFCLRGPSFRRNLLPPSSRLNSRLTIARCLVSENHILRKYSSPVSTQTLRLFTVSTKAVRPLCVHGETGIHTASDPKCARSYFPRVKSPELHPYSGFVSSGNVIENLMFSHVKHVKTQSALTCRHCAADILQTEQSS